MIVYCLNININQPLCCDCLRTFMSFFFVALWEASFVQKETLDGMTQGLD